MPYKDMTNSLKILHMKVLVPDQILPQTCAISQHFC